MKDYLDSFDFHFTDISPQSLTFSIDSTEHIHSPFSQTRAIINTPNVAHLEATKIDSTSNNESNEIRCIYEHEELVNRSRPLSLQSGRGCGIETVPVEEDVHKASNLRDKIEFTVERE